MCTEGRDTSTTGRVMSVLRSPDAWGTTCNKQPAGSRVSGLSARISMTWHDSHKQIRIGQFDMIVVCRMLCAFDAVQTCASQFIT